jgi:glycogen debranching enzyme
MTDVAGLTDAFVLKEGAAFLVSRQDGAVPVAGAHALGLYVDDCRHLSGHELRIAGAAPRLLVSFAATGADGVHELTNPDLRLPGGEAVPAQTLRIRLGRRLTPEGRLEERVGVHLYGRRALELDLELAFAADFRPMLAIRGIADVPAADVAVAPVERGVRFGAVTSDGVERATTIVADREPAEVAGGVLRFRLALEPGGHQEIGLAHRPTAGQRAARRTAAPPARAEDTRVQTDDELFNRVLERSLQDLRTLRSPLDGGWYYAAGVPWYATLFGRDSLIAALEALAFAPWMAEETLRLLAGRRGRRTDPVHEEEPGKILHELRAGEVAARGLSPLTRYFGSVDATPLFLCLLSEHAAWSGDVALFHELGDAVDEALAWIDEHGDHDGDGLLDYRAGTPDGLRNQGWKDSGDGVVDEHGVPLEPPIALIEPQAYAVRAKRGIARLAEHDGDAARAARLRAEADALAERLERFWIAERGCYGMALDGDGRLSRALASNQGHALWARAVPPDRARSARSALMGEALFSGWGLRTLGAGETAFNPVGYHLGTVWPHDTALAAVGLRRYGFDEDFTAIFEALLQAACGVADLRLPELFAGFARADPAPPVPYPVACHPQAWAAGAIPYLLATGLGLAPDGLRRRLRIRRPSLPRWVSRVEVGGLQIAGARVHLRFERVGSGHVALTDARVDGDVEVTLEVSARRSGRRTPTRRRRAPR